MSHVAAVRQLLEVAAHDRLAVAEHALDEVLERLAPVDQLELAAFDTHFIFRGKCGTHISFKRTEMNRGAQLKPDGIVPGFQGIGDLNGILQVEHHQSFLKKNAIDVVPPGGKLVLQ